MKTLAPMLKKQQLKLYFHAKHEMERTDFFLHVIANLWALFSNENENQSSISIEHKSK
jgi:hypothetical protein